MSASMRGCRDSSAARVCRRRCNGPTRSPLARLGASTPASGQFLAHHANLPDRDIRDRRHYRGTTPPGRPLEPTVTGRGLRHWRTKDDSCHSAGTWAPIRRETCGSHAGTNRAPARPNHSGDREHLHGRAPTETCSSPSQTSNRPPPWPSGNTSSPRTREGRSAMKRQEGFTNCWRERRKTAVR